MLEEIGYGGTGACPTVGTLCTKHGNSHRTRPVHLRAPCTQTDIQTHIHNLAQVNIASLPILMFLDSKREKPENSEETLTNLNTGNVHLPTPKILTGTFRQL